MVAGCVLGVTLLAAAGVVQAPPSRPSVERLETGGFWPTHRMMESLIGRWAEMVASRYELDERQQKELLSQMQRRWLRFADDNEKLLKPLFNDYVEMRLQMEQPTKEQIIEWSQRAAKAFDLFESEINRGTEEMRNLLREDQLPKFEADVLGFQAGMQFARIQLGRWQQGEYREQEFWDPPMAVRRARRAEEEARRAAAEKSRGEADAAAVSTAPPDQVAAEVDAWQKYVEEFIARYRLDTAQQKTARSILHEMRERALSFRDANKLEIDRLEERIAASRGTPEETAAIEKDLKRLYGPIDALFEEMKRRLEPIPTAEQKAAAGKRDAEVRAKAKAAEKSSDADKPRGDLDELEVEAPPEPEKSVKEQVPPPVKTPQNGKEPKKKS